MSLSTHVLDTMHGQPAAGMAFRLLTETGDVLAEGVTNQDGRYPGLPPVEPGRYRIAFKVADYFRDRGVALPDPPFLDVVTIDFGISDDGHYHVPLLISPFSYSTYRGS